MDFKRLIIGPELPGLDGFRDGDVFVVAGPGTMFQAQPSNGGWQGFDTVPMQGEIIPQGPDGLGGLLIFGLAMQQELYSFERPSVLADIAIDASMQPQGATWDGQAVPDSSGVGAVIRVMTPESGRYGYEILKPGVGYTRGQMIVIPGDILGGDKVDNRLVLIVDSLLNPSA